MGSGAGPRGSIRFVRWGRWFRMRSIRLNGEVKQSGSTEDLIFPIAELLRYITAAMTLEPGDVIPTGTPALVGPVQAGDIIQIEIDGLGTLENTFAPEPNHH